MRKMKELDRSKLAIEQKLGMLLCAPPALGIIPYELE